MRNTRRTVIILSVLMVLNMALGFVAAYQHDVPRCIFNTFVACFCAMAAVVLAHDGN